MENNGAKGGRGAAGGAGLFVLSVWLLQDVFGPPCLLLSAHTLCRCLPALRFPPVRCLPINSFVIFTLPAAVCQHAAPQDHLCFCSLTSVADIAEIAELSGFILIVPCLLYTSPSPRDRG
eukprot:3020763-Rhodomonas_salina.2